jgi:hypothetical protein
MNTQEALDILNNENIAAKIEGDMMEVTEWHLHAFRAISSLAHTQPTSIEAIVEDLIKLPTMFGASNESVEYVVGNKSLIIDDSENDSVSKAIEYNLYCDCDSDDCYMTTNGSGNSTHHPVLSTSINMFIAEMSIRELEAV